MKIGIVGSGKIGGLVGTLWAKAGHKVKFSSRHPEQLNGLVASAGENASAGEIAEAIQFGEIIFLSIPYVALEQFGKDHGRALAGKIVIETGNPYPERDGAIGREVRESPLGTGHYSALWLPGCDWFGDSTACGMGHWSKKLIGRRPSGHSLGQRRCGCYGNRSEACLRRGL